MAKILLLSDHPLIPSGVGTQAKRLIEGLLEKDPEHRFICLGGALAHRDYSPQKVAPEKFGDRWFIIPVDGHGNKEILRQILTTEKPDVIVLFTDPRFFNWLWEIEDEVRLVCPIVYWHVWDNDPVPDFNRPIYDSTDHIVSLSLKTHGIMQALGYENETYIPHSVCSSTFKPLSEVEIEEFKRKNMPQFLSKKFFLFWNNRNARRKQPGDVIQCFAKFANRVGHENVALLMHTQVADPEGQNLLAVAKKFGIERELIINEEMLLPEHLNMFYNIADVTINIASNEGFGLSTLESLSSGTPVVVHMTGGLQFQAGDWWDGLRDFSDQEKLTNIARQYRGNWWGKPVFSASRSCTGGQQIPYINDDRVKTEDVVEALHSLYNIGRPARKLIGARARDWVIENFNEEDMINDWDRVIKKVVGSRNINGHRPFSIISI